MMANVLCCPDYRFFVPQPGRYRVILSSDSADFGGFQRVDESLTYETFREDGVDKLSLYVTSRTALVLAKV